MVRRAFAPVVLAVVLACLSAGPALAQSAGDPIIRMDTSSTIELDLGLMMRDILPRLMPILAVEDPSDTATVRLLADYLGLESLGHLRLEISERRDRSTTKALITVPDPEADGLLPRLFRQPNGRCRFARYVGKDRLVTFSTLPDFAGALGIVLDELDRPELAEVTARLPRDADGNLSLGGFIPRTDLLPLLAGELDAFILEPADGAPLASPTALPLYLVLGSTDGFALRDRLLRLADDLGGESAGALTGMVTSLTPEQVGDFEVTSPPFGGVVAVSRDFLVVGMDPDPLRDLLARPAGDLDVPDGVQWVVMDGPRYGRLMSSLTALGGAMAPGAQAGAAWMPQLYDALYSSMESEEVLYRTTDKGLEIRSRVDGPVMSGLYRMGLAVLDELPAILEQEKQEKAAKAVRERYSGILLELDAAMTSWGADHDGTFPDDPHELVTAGYLDAFPLGDAVPPGGYEPDGYTYLILHDANGRNAGYFLFIYGPERDNGYDVFTPENVKAKGNFVIGRDGRRDGVINFCYDGLAIPQVEAYNRQ